MSRKVCVITGSSSGIGAATARLYASHGWNMVVNYSRKAEPAEAVAAECRAMGVDVLVLRADVAQDADCRAMAQQVQDAWGRVDVLVNNAGTTKFANMKNLDALQADDFHAIYAVNVIGPYQMIRAFEPLLRKHPVSGVVNVSSISSMLGTGSSIAYMASKGALNAMTIGLARALGPGIRVNAIAPGLVETPWMQDGLGAGRYEAAVSAYKVKSVLDAVLAPEDVAQTAWYLGAQAAKTTGEVLLVDAGLRLTRA